jgi:predicted DNA-binding transcriptional regulator AlpA
MPNDGNAQLLNGQQSEPETPATTEDRQLVSVESVAKMFDVSPRTVWRWNSAGEIPAPIKVAGTTRWRRTDLLRWIDGGCQPLVPQHGTIAYDTRRPKSVVSSLR